MTDAQAGHRKQVRERRIFECTTLDIIAMLFARPGCTWYINHILAVIVARKAKIHTGLSAAAVKGQTAHGKASALFRACSKHVWVWTGVKIGGSGTHAHCLILISVCLSNSQFA